MKRLDLIISILLLPSSHEASPLVRCLILVNGLAFPTPFFSCALGFIIATGVLIANLKDDVVLREHLRFPTVDKSDFIVVPGPSPELKGFRIIVLSIFIFLGDLV